MKRLFVSCFIFGIFLFVLSAQATEKKDFKEFTIELPDGWKMPMEAQYTQYGVIATFLSSNGSGDIKNMVVNFPSSMGKSMEDLLADAKTKASNRGVSFKSITRQTDTRVVYIGEQINGMPFKMIAVLDPENKKLAILTMGGKWEEFEDVAKSIIPVNPKLKFF